MHAPRHPRQETRVTWELRLVIDADRQDEVLEEVALHAQGNPGLRPTRVTPGEPGFTVATLSGCNPRELRTIGAVFIENPFVAEVHYRQSPQAEG